MNSNIDTRAPFFPHTRSNQAEISKARDTQALKRNSFERSKELSEITAKDATVTIPDAIKDFSRIKRAVDATPEIDNSAKIASLKAQIQAGSYEPDYDEIADKILSSEY